MMEKNEVYAHINNGGVVFSVNDSPEVEIVITANHFGNQTNQIKLCVTPQVLGALADMFSAAATKYANGSVYVCAARLVDLGGTGQTAEGSMLSES